MVVILVVNSPVVGGSLMSKWLVVNLMDCGGGKQSSQIQNVVWCVTEFVFKRDGQRGRPPPPETELELIIIIIIINSRK